MESPMLVFALIPLLLGGAVFVGLLVLTRLMPGEAVPSGKAAAPKAVAVAAPARGPEYVALTGKRKAAYRLGLLVLLALGVLTVIEYFAAFTGSTVLMFVFIVLKGAAIMYFFMHITTLWKSEEAH